MHWFLPKFEEMGEELQHSEPRIKLGQHPLSAKQASVQGTGSGLVWCRDQSPSGQLNFCCLTKVTRNICVLLWYGVVGKVIHSQCPKTVYNLRRARDLKFQKGNDSTTAIMWQVPVFKRNHLAGVMQVGNVLYRIGIIDNFQSHITKEVKHWSQIYSGHH